MNLLFEQNLGRLVYSFCRAECFVYLSGLQRPHVLMGYVSRSTGGYWHVEYVLHSDRLCAMLLQIITGNSDAKGENCCLLDSVASFNKIIQYCVESVEIIYPIKVAHV